MPGGDAEEHLGGSLAPIAATYRSYPDDTQKSGILPQRTQRTQRTGKTALLSFLRPRKFADFKFVGTEVDEQAVLHSRRFQVT